MNTLSGEIPVGSKRATVVDSQPAGLGFVGSFSSPVTPRPCPPTTTQTDADGDSSDVGSDVTEFSGLTDAGLLDSISRSRGMLSLRLPDGGEKMRVRIRRMEKELDRRLATGPRKDGMTRGPSVEPSRRDDSHAFKDGDKLNWEKSPSKCHHNVPTNSTENYGQVDKFAFVKELSYFGQEKNTCLKKVGQSAQTPASHQPKNHAVRPKSSGKKKLYMDSNITDNRRKTGFKGSLRNRQKNNSVDLKGIPDKLYTKDDTFGRSTKRWEHSKIHIDFRNFFNSNKRNENKDVVLLDDEDMEPTELVDVEVADKWDESKIYYPSRTDLESVELLYSDMKCLEPEEYLKSPVINFYIQYLRKSRTRGDLYMFNTYFYSKLEEELSRTGDNDDTQFSKLRRWWKSVDIFRKAYIILPIHGMMHWSLIIICMPAKETESGPIILHLDSLDIHSSHEVFGVIESYLKAEWRHLQKDDSYDIPFSGRIWRHLSKNINKKKLEVPRQCNPYDCGIFMLYYIERFIQEAPERMTRENLSMFGRKWFDPEETSGLREGMRALLFDVFETARREDGSSQAESHSDGH